MENPFYTSSSNWWMQERSITQWTREENKRFESALAIFDKETPDRWMMVAAMIPGKSILDVMSHYKELLEDVSDIEAGLVPIPGYTTFNLEKLATRKRYSSSSSSLIGRACHQERKKGVPWTEDEHRRFLLGLEEHGRGDWRNISRNFVISKTPTQVASHAQKYYLRLLSSTGGGGGGGGGGKQKKRPSIHDITTFHLQNASFRSSSPLEDKPTVQVLERPRVMAFGPNDDDPFLDFPYGMASYDLRELI